MSQVDYDIVDQPGASFRSDLNDTLEAIVSNNSGATQPDDTFAYMWWMDTNANILKQRNAANTAWISKLKLANSYVNVDNTSDANKPVSTAGQTALNLKADQSTTYTETEVDALIRPVVGEVKLFSGNTSALNTMYVRGWRIADGTDGAPDLIDSFPKMGTFAQKTGAGGAKTVTPAGGISVSTSVNVSNHTLSIAEMPSHNHGGTADTGAAIDESFQGPEKAAERQNTSNTGSSNSHGHGTSASSSGSFSGTSHTNEPQFTYLVPLYFTGVAGTYP